MIVWPVSLKCFHHIIDVTSVWKMSSMITALYNSCHFIFTFRGVKNFRVKTSGTGASIELLELTARCPSRACWRPGWSHSCCWATFSSPVDWSSAVWCCCPLSCGGWIDSCTARSTSAWPTPTGVVSLLILQARLESWVNFHFQELLHLNNLLLSRAANHYILAVVCYAQGHCDTFMIISLHSPSEN